MTAVLDSEHGLRRALVDPSRDGDDRAGLVRAVLGDRVGGATADLLSWVVRARWSVPRDLADAVELLAVEAQVAAAEKAGRLDDGRGRAVPRQPDRGRRSRAALGAVRPSGTGGEPSRPDRGPARRPGHRRDPPPGPPGRRRTAWPVVRPHGRDLRPGGRRPAPPAGRHRDRDRAPHRGAAGPARCRAARGSTGTRCTSTSSSTPPWSAASGSRSATRSIDGSVVGRLDDARRRLVG